MLREVGQHPYMLLASAVMCLPLLPFLIRFFFPFRTTRSREDDGFYFGSGFNSSYDDYGFWIPLELFWPVIRFALLLAIYGISMLGICCGLMTLFA